MPENAVATKNKKTNNKAVARSDSIKEVPNMADMVGDFAEALSSKNSLLEMFTDGLFCYSGSNSKRES